MLSSKSTKRGFGSCPQCGHSYVTRRKPPNCEECGYDLGGTNQPAPKKPKRNCPSAVLFVGSSHFSCKTSTKEDRCFVIKEGESVFCTQQQCMDVRATFVSSGRAENFSCKHSDLCSDSVPALQTFHLSAEKIDSYNGDSASKESLSALLIADSSLPAVFKVSDVSFVVRGFPSTNNTLGYCHVRVKDGALACCSKDSDCKAFVAKVRYERTRKICVHLHAVLCTGAFTVEEPPSTGDSDHPVAAAESTTSTSTASTQRLRTLELNVNRQLAYDFISPDLLRVIDEQNARSWPTKFAPTATACKLCGHNLGEEVKHPGSEGQAYLLTMARPFAKVDVRVLICKNSACRAIHQADPANIGKWVLFSML